MYAVLVRVILDSMRLTRRFSMAARSWDMFLFSYVKETL